MPTTRYPAQCGCVQAGRNRDAGGKTLRFGSSDWDADYGPYLKPDYDNGITVFTIGERFDGTDLDVLTIKGDDSSGNVGIGVTNPGYRLTINAASGGGDGMMVQNSSGNMRADLWVAGSDYGCLELYDTSTAKTINLIATGSSYLNGGNVGIGNTAPDTKLHVNGAITLGAAGGPQIISGSGAPGAALPNGSLYFRTDGTGPNLYVRQNGAWVSK